MSAFASINLMIMLKKTDPFAKIKPVFFILVQSVKNLIQDDGPHWAAAIAYYSLLSIFPLLLAAVSLASFFVDPSWAVDKSTSLLTSYLPGSGSEIAVMIKDAIEERESVSIIAIILLLWTGSRVFGVLTKAINIAFKVKDFYSFQKRLLIEIMMVITVGFLFVIALASQLLIRFLDSQFSFFPTGQTILTTVLIQIVSDLVLLVVFFLLYRYVPNYEVSNRAAFWGSFVATLCFITARPLFLGYLRTFTNISLIYGSLAIVVILLTWTWLIALFILLGGEITSQIQFGSQKEPGDQVSQNITQPNMKTTME